MFWDVLGHSETYWGCFGMFWNVSGRIVFLFFFDVLGYFLMFWWCFGTFLDVLSCFWGVLGCFMTCCLVLGFFGCFETFWDVLLVFLHFLGRFGTF